MAGTPARVMPRQLRVGASCILYDEALIGPPGREFFDPDHWRGAGALDGVAEGRGAAAFFHHDGRDYVLRHYRRGGWVARLSADRYCWSGLERTRAWREWRLLAALCSEGLPVPRPVAAHVSREGPFYRADLVTLRIPDATPLAERLMRGPIGDPAWRAVGAAVRRLHDAGVNHADLNARNILLAGDGSVHIIDLDKSRRVAGKGDWRAANLARLRRSLDKFHATVAQFHFEARDWARFEAGYRASQGSSAST